MTNKDKLEEIEKQKPPQDMLQWADDQVLLNIIKNIYQPNQQYLIARVKMLTEAIEGNIQCENCSSCNTRNRKALSDGEGEK